MPAANRIAAESAASQRDSEQSQTQSIKMASEFFRRNSHESGDPGFLNPVACPGSLLSQGRREFVCAQFATSKRRASPPHCEKSPPPEQPLDIGEPQLH